MNSETYVLQILLIDNGTNHLAELEKLLAKHTVTIIKSNEIEHISTKNTDLIVLTGSTGKSLAHHPDIYRKEIELVQKTSTPVIGICMGCEVIAYTYGATLVRLPERDEGLVEIDTVEEDPIFDNTRKFHAIENHHWAITDIKAPLKVLARSKDGIEVIAHQDKQLYGFQFHPEIISESNEGTKIFDNVLQKIVHFNELKESVRALVIHSNKALLMYREKKGRNYYSIPGGKVEEGETLEQTIKRELLEETTIQAEPTEYLGKYVDPERGKVQHLYLCKYLSGEPKLGEFSVENIAMQENGKNYYRPEWVDINDIQKLTVRPKVQEEAYKKFIHEFIAKNSL